MANIDQVQLPDGSNYNIVDNTSGFATQNYVDSAVSSVTKTTIGLGNVDNTSDLNKPISTATQTALDTLDEDKADKTDIAPVESSSTASQTYQICEQFYYNGVLYKATAVIANGGTITINGNCVASNSLVAQLEDKQNKTDNSLTTTNKNIVDAINELNLIKGLKYMGEAHNTGGVTITPAGVSMGILIVANNGYGVGGIYILQGILGDNTISITPLVSSTYITITVNHKQSFNVSSTAQGSVYFCELS